jgi:hypothetical protein
MSHRGVGLIVAHYDINKKICVNMDLDILLDSRNHGFEL